MTEVEAQALGPDHGALLFHVLAEDLAQGPVQHVGAGVVSPNGIASFDIDRGEASGRQLDLPSRYSTTWRWTPGRRRRCRALEPRRSRS